MNVTDIDPISQPNEFWDAADSTLNRLYDAEYDGCIDEKNFDTDETMLLMLTQNRDYVTANPEVAVHALAAINERLDEAGAY